MIKRNKYYMDVLNLVKIITAIISVIFAFIVGIRVLLLNPENLLNRWYALFFLSSSVGFSTYTIYHFITFNADIIIPIMITAQIFFNLLFVSLVMTVFVLEKFEKIAMGLKYLGTMMALFIIMSFGYFIFVPSLNTERFEQGIVDTETPFGWFIFVNVIRIGLSIYVVYKYAMMTRKIGEETKKRVQWLFVGIIIITIGLLLNLAGGISGIILIEIFALIAFDIGTILLFKGFLIK